MKENKKPKNSEGAYRPTVRYHSIYRTYVNSLFESTKLDRNQIIRCALFTAAYNPAFLNLMNQYKISDVPLPSPLWKHSNHQLWLEQESNIEKKGGGEYDDLERKRKATSASTLLGTSAGSRSMPRATIQSNQQSSTSEKEASFTRRQQSIERQTRALPALQLSNNGGIRLDLR